MLQGSFVALVTPFQNGNLDEEALRRLIDRQIKAGTDWLVPCGTTGESPTLSHEDHKRVVEITIEQAQGKAHVLAGTGSNNTNEALALSQHAAKAGADGILVITPYYNKPPQEGLYRHFEAITKAVPLPMVLYNVPGRTAVNLEIPTLVRLTRIPEVQAIKEASGSLSRVAAIRNASDITILSGDDLLTYPMMALGAKGSISVTANVVPEWIHAMIHSALKGNWSEARNWHEKMVTLNTHLFLETNPVPVKAALTWMGLIQEELRLPLCPLASQHRETLQQTLTSLKLIERETCQS